MAACESSHLMDVTKRVHQKNELAGFFGGKQQRNNYMEVRVDHRVPKLYTKYDTLYVDVV